MASKVTGAVSGARRFKAFPAAVAGRIDGALQKGAEEVRDRAKAIAPKDTGELRRAIEVRATLDGFGASGAVGNFGRMVKGAAGNLQRFIGVFPATKGAAGWYAAFVEFGTAARSTGQRYATRGGAVRKAQGKAGGALGDFHPGAPARPFLRPAFFSLRQRVIGRIKRAVTAAAKEIARGGSDD